MRARSLTAAAAAILLAGCAKSRQEPNLLESLADRASASPEVEADTRALAALGARVTGSLACAKGEELAGSRLREAGLVPVLEEYAAPAGAASERTGRNVIADLTGTDPSRGLVLLAAHLDAVAAGEGASDDAVNVAVLLEAARTLRALAPPPRRKIRFAFFTGEEQRMAGSSAYIAARGAEAHALAIVFDQGSAEVKGFYMNGRKEPLRALFMRALAPDPRWRALFGTYEIWTGCDAMPFVEAGIPVLTAFQPDPEYARIRHTVADTAGRVDFASARRNAGLAAALAFGAADDPGPDLPRMSREEVAVLLARHGVSASSLPSARPGAR